jgi:hypothetical protein
MTRVKPAVPLLGGILRNIDGVTAVKAERVEPLAECRRPM